MLHEEKIAAQLKFWCDSCEAKVETQMEWKTTRVRIPVVAGFFLFHLSYSTIAKEYRFLYDLVSEA